MSDLRRPRFIHRTAIWIGLLVLAVAMSFALAWFLQDGDVNIPEHVDLGDVPLKGWVDVALPVRNGSGQPVAFFDLAPV